MSERKVITRSPMNVRGYFISIKCARPMPWETPLERDAMLILEFDREVTFFKQHQRATRVDDADGAFTTYPDIEFVRTGRQCVLEVKRDIDLKNDELRSRLQRTKLHFLYQGVDYQVWNTTVIRQEPRLTNLKELAYHRFRGGATHLRSLPQIQNALGRPYRTLGDIAENVGGWAAALTLVANDILVIDLEQPVSQTSVVRRAGEIHGTI
jgi:hypothetical protein